MILDVPSVGCAKTRLVGEHAEPAPRRGSAAPLVLDGRQVGVVLRTRDGVAPLYVSPGHRIDAETAARLVLACCRGVRIPEPTRRAHMEVNRVRRGEAGPAEAPRGSHGA
jgi:deoxyribonuclease V